MAEETVYISLADVGRCLLVTGVILLVLVLVHASGFEGVPLNQLGRRPKGKGLVSWCYHSWSEGVGVSGYDPILGALSPLLRMLVHASVVIVFAGARCLVNINHQSYSALVSNCFQTLGFYLVICWLIQKFHRPVSWIGEPRPHKITRKPCWQNKEIPLKLDEWHYISAQDSHAFTEERFVGVKLTGEASGRDIWIQSSITCASSDQAMQSFVKKMASGGRTGDFNPSINPNSCDIPHRTQMIRDYLAAGNPPPSKEKASTIEQALRQGVHFYSMLQSKEGHWSGEFGGPHFLMPTLIVAWYIMGRPASMLDEGACSLIRHYLTNHQQADGGWGTHVESPSTMFGSVLIYLALRLLGMDKHDPIILHGRKFIHEQGGAIMTSTWSKFYLCILGCMDWNGHNSIPPEMWLLPNWFPFHPGRMWCHSRMVYLPMGYLYGHRFVYENAETDPLILSLRNELYLQRYNEIPWITTRHMVAPMDNYSPISWFMKTVQNILARYETWAFIQPFKNWIRGHGLKFCAEYLAAEDLQTNFINLGPINKVLNMICAYHVSGRDLSRPEMVSHMARVADYLWLAEDGMKVKGCNGSQCWDTSFAIQAINEAGLLDDFPETAKKAWTFLERSQVFATEVSMATEAFQYESAMFRKKFYRHSSQGGWAFGTSAQGWPVSDCTAEALKAILCLSKCQTIQKAHGAKRIRQFGQNRLESACDLLLTFQNEDGGFATYENNRGFRWYERLNPCEIFEDIMIDYSYCECSMASLTALADFHEQFPTYRRSDILHALDKGRSFLKSMQRENGSWYGCWACCFCYGGWFGIEGLLRCGEPTTSPTIQKACRFLLRHQRANGGWGEDLSSCYDKSYAQCGMEAYGDEGSGIVSTAWALLALAAAECDDIRALKRGVQYLIKRQLPYGDWPQEGVSGSFCRSCGIAYSAYRNIFPVWALGRCRTTYGSLLNE